MLFEGFNPNEKYTQLKKINENINKDINKLKYIKDNIIIYYKETYQDIIKKIIEVIRENKNKKINYYKGEKVRGLIKETYYLQDLSDEINKVKNFLLFEIIYDMIRER